MVNEFVAHDSKLQFGSLNHGPAANLNIACAGQPRGLRGDFQPSKEGALVGGSEPDGLTFFNSPFSV
jgi:hypothetical protein